MKKKIAIGIVVIIILGLFCYYQNNDIKITNIDFKNDKISKEIDGYKILQISDLHNKQFGKDNKKLVKLTKEIKPDIIVITGDIIDSRRTNTDVAIRYINQIKKVAPIYYSPGNHESRISEYQDFENRLAKQGVNILNDKSKSIKINNDSIDLIGVRDISFIQKENRKEELSNIINNLKNKDDSKLSILLSHRPDLIDLYAKESIDLVFSGHAHGGQVRLPFIGGILAPDQGLFPKYTSGIYNKDNTHMIVSRGLGNSLFPLRVFNKPELVVTTLKSK
ncbi:metallophosphoesterase [Romboutsia sedimentorum]|uniref:metallophosphoesterase n=1 Tax=Romboutsia sedimentorum TaxID=1368474 RepID=UPI0024DE0C33|nr:metallophosphoesterase [Romboutsia sedimentorum]MDK2584611.1 metallophosphoesterase [Romboutsia sedimentorum]